MFNSHNGRRLELGLGCPEKLQLIRQYSDCLGAYRDAVEKLKNGVADGMGEYLQLATRAAGARVVCEQARLAVEQHIIEHKC